jgi:GT2 family glycosyltransferase
MGMSKEVYRKTQGFIITRMGEDIEFSIRAISLGFKSGLIPEAFIYHKRRTSFVQFYKQLRFLEKQESISVAFFLKNSNWCIPFLWYLPLPCLVFLYGGWCSNHFSIWLLVFLIYTLLNFIDSTFKNKSIQVGLLSIIAVYVQLVGYGIGFFQKVGKNCLKKKDTNS